MSYKKSYEPAVCADGFTVSIQGAERNYCSPRNNTGPYSSVELGYPSASDSLILEFAEDKTDPTGTVYGWVPSHIVLELLEKHGGWVGGELPPMVIESDVP